MSAPTRKALVLLPLAILLVAAPAAADIVNFPKGTLIIPEQSSFQTPCGTLAAYGLVYRILLANQAGGYFDPIAHPGRTPVTVYWVVGGSKASPNRCVPTNLSTPPGGGAWNATGSPGWNDGCDMRITNALDQPVTPVDYSINPWTSGAKDGIFPIVNLPMRTPSVVDRDPTRNGGGVSYVQLTVKGASGTAIFDAATLLAGDGSPSVASTATITVKGTGGGNKQVVSILDSAGTTVGSVTSTSTGTFSVAIKIANIGQLVPGPGVAIGATQIWYTVTNGTAIAYNGYQSPEAIPAYPAVTTLTKASGFTDIQYMGGPFLIHQSDAQAVIEFLQNGDGSNTQVPAAATGAVPARTVDVLSEYTGAKIGYGALTSRAGGYFDLCTGPKLTINGLASNGTSPLTSHYVTMHQALTSFTANVSRRINVAPPKIALLDTQSNGDATGSASVSGLLILDSYLANAGLYLANTTAGVDSGGCPTGSQAGCKINGGKTGFIYDQFDANADLVPQAAYPTGILGTKDAAGKSIYGVLWSPHWETKNNSKVYSFQSPAGASGAAGMKNIAAFLDQSGKGLMGACASVGSYEGGGGITAYGAPNTNFLFSGKVDTNGLNANDGVWEGINCTDPNYPNNVTAACTTINSGTCTSFDATTTNECMVWDNTTSEFGQIGDFHFVQNSGTIDDFKPAKGVVYNAATRVLATSWTKYKSGDYPTGGSGCDLTDPTCDNHWDIIDVGSKDNDPTKGTIVYIAGHDYQISTVGSRIILNTLLNLGQNPVFADRALSAPTVYSDPNGARDPAGTAVTGKVPLVFTGVYDLVSGVANTRFQYNWSQGSQWIFPKTPGNVFEHPLIQVGAISKFGAGISKFTDSVLFDAQAQLAKVYGGNAATRNVFTYFGGSVTAGATYPHGALQKGWVPSPVEPQEVTQSGCVDVLAWGKVSDGKHPAYFGLTKGSDGICDLYEATQLIPVAGGVDFGLSEAVANVAKLKLSTSIDAAKGMLQVVQGYCFATTTKADNSGTTVIPSSSTSCNQAFDPVNRPVMGGVLHSTPAVVSPSDNVSDLGAARPTVLYTAGADGQLHAFYVSGGAGYKGPASSLSFPNPGAATVFNTSWGSSFVPPEPMTELWSYLPASQLPLLAANGQLVDSAPVVQDVFADFSNTGIREWHTVVVATAGGPLGNPGSEVFALDVTNPLKPVLLWDLMGTWTGPVGTVSPIAVANFPATTYPGAATIVQTARGVGYPAAGSTVSSVYDFSTLGASYGLSLGVVRTGSDLQFPIFLSTNFAQDTTNAPLTNGAQVYALDTFSGQILWHWIQPYATSGNIPGDPVPQPVTLIPDKFGAISTVYVGDMEGRIWELPAKTGVNPWTGSGVGNSGAIFYTGASAEPLTTPISITRLPVITASAPAPSLKPWSAKVIALVGTNNSPDGYVTANGKLHVANIDSASRPVTGVAPADNTLSLSPFPFTFINERVSGNIAVIGQTAYLSTTTRTLSDPLLIDRLATGGAYSIDLGAVTSSTTVASLPYFVTQGTYGGVALYYDAAKDETHVIGSQVSQMSQVIVSPAAGTKPNASLSIDKPAGGLLYHFLGWLKRTL